MGSEYHTPNIFTCFETARDVLERDWYPIFVLPCGGEILVRGKDMPRAAKCFARGKDYPESEFPLKKLSVACRRVDVDKKFCPAVKRLFDAYGMTRNVTEYRRFPFRSFFVDEGAVHLDLESGTCVNDDRNDVFVRKSDLDASRFPRSKSLEDIFRDSYQEINGCGNERGVVHARIIAFFKHLICKSIHNRLSGGLIRRRCRDGEWCLHAAGRSEQTIPGNGLRRK